MITIFSLNMVVQASFPVTDSGVNTEVVSDNTNLAIEAPARSGGPGMAIAGLVLGIIQVLLVVVVLLLVGAAISSGLY